MYVQEQRGDSTGSLTSSSRIQVHRGHFGEPLTRTEVGYRRPCFTATVGARNISKGSAFLMLPFQRSYSLLLV